MQTRWWPTLCFALIASTFAMTAQADPARADQAAQRGPIPVPAGARRLADVPCGAGPRETFDAYVPAGARDAPVIFMVHGGAWRFGDKGASSVVQNKIDHWLPDGIIVVSVDYPMAGATPLDEARSVGKALAVAQREAPRWAATRIASC